MISRWAPPAEKGKFVAALMGNTLGTVVTWPLLGVIIESIGWIWAFVVPGAVGVVWAIIWICTVADSPSEHKWISEEEKNYIVESLNTSVKRVKVIYEISVRCALLKIYICFREYRLIKKSLAIWASGL